MMPAERAEYATLIASRISISMLMIDELRLRLTSLSKALDDIAIGVIEHADIGERTALLVALHIEHECDSLKAVLDHLRLARGIAQGLRR